MNDPATYWRVIAVTLAALSLVWNIANTILAICINARGKRRSIRLDEFRSTIRDPIRNALDDVEAIGGRAKALASSGTDLVDLRNEAVQLNRSAVESLGKLEDVLYQANQSTFAQGTNWLSDSEISHDKVYNHFNEANNPAHSEATVRAALIKVHSEIREIRGLISSRLEEQIESHG